MYPSLENSTTLITTTPTNRCQWTKIYGEEGPSQGASAPGAGRAGQCKTSADCASRVPYCSKLGYCHGGRLPFDEAQLEINVRLWQYRLWSFQGRNTKSERFLAKNQL